MPLSNTQYQKHSSHIYIKYAIHKSVSNTQLTYLYQIRSSHMCIVVHSSHCLYQIHSSHIYIKLHSSHICMKYIVHIFIIYNQQMHNIFNAYLFLKSLLHVSIPYCIIREFFLVLISSQFPYLYPCFCQFFVHQRDKCKPITSDVIAVLLIFNILK